MIPVLTFVTFFYFNIIGDIFLKGFYLLSAIHFLLVVIFVSLSDRFIRLLHLRNYLIVRICGLILTPTIFVTLSVVLYHANVNTGNLEEAMRYYWSLFEVEERAGLQVITATGCLFMLISYAIGCTITRGLLMIIPKLGQYILGRTKKCEWCKENIKTDALICKHCGKMVKSD